MKRNETIDMTNGGQIRGAITFPPGTNPVIINAVMIYINTGRLLIPSGISPTEKSILMNCINSYLKLLILKFLKLGDLGSSNNKSGD